MPHFVFLTFVNFDLRSLWLLIGEEGRYHSKKDVGTPDVRLGGQISEQKNMEMDKITDTVFCIVTDKMYVLNV